MTYPREGWENQLFSHTVFILAIFKWQILNWNLREFHNSLTIRQTEQIRTNLPSASLSPDPQAFSVFRPSNSEDLSVGDSPYDERYLIILAAVFDQLLSHPRVLYHLRRTNVHSINIIFY